MFGIFSLFSYGNVIFWVCMCFFFRLFALSNCRVFDGFSVFSNLKLFFSKIFLCLNILVKKFASFVAFFHLNATSLGL